MRSFGTTTCVRRAAAVCLATSAALLIAGCGSTSGAGTTSTSTSRPARGGATTSTTVSQASPLKAAEAALVPYAGHPSAFPVVGKLTKRPKPGTTFDFLECGAPACAVYAQLLQAPTKALGVTLKVIPCGFVASQVQAAAAAALANHPAAVLIGGVDPQLFGGYIEKLRHAGIVVTGIGIVDGGPYGLQADVGSQSDDIQGGQLMADWVAAHVGKSANAVFFGSPELAFSPLMQSAFSKQLVTVCPTCKVADSQISVLDIGSTAPQMVVSYLQAHPGTNTAVFATMEVATGLAAALKEAGIHITTLGFGPSGSNFSDIRSGGLTAGFDADASVATWLWVTATAQLLAHQSVPQTELHPDLEFLTKSNVTAADATSGWTGYPDVASRIERLWPKS